MFAYVVTPSLTEKGKLRIRGRKFYSDAENGLLHTLYDVIDCDAVEHITMQVANQVYHVWVDEEGKLRNKLPCIYVPEIPDVLVGTVVITKDEEGTEKFTNDETALLKCTIKEQLAWFLECAYRAKHK